LETKLAEQVTTPQPDEPENWTISIQSPGRSASDSPASLGPRIEDEAVPMDSPPEEMHVPPQMTPDEGLTPEQRLMRMLDVDL
jgi:hypothetical protein